MDDREAYDFYADPANRVPAGPGRRRKADRLTEVVSFRLSERLLEQAAMAAEGDNRDLSDWLRKLVSAELVRLSRERRERERPAGLIEGSGRKGEMRALPSSLGTVNGHGQMFTCPHLSIGNVVAASCGTCGPLAPAA